MTMENTLFTIITPTSSRADLLKRAISSTILQTYTNFEHLIIDDTNDPATKALIDEFNDERVILYTHSSPKGASGGYNTGIENSKGDFILFLDDDDEYLPQMLERCYNFFKDAQSDIGFIWCGIVRVADKESREEIIYSKVWPSQFSNAEERITEASSIGNGFGLCVRRECIMETGLYDPSLSMGQDTEYLLRLASKYNCATIPEVLVIIHHHNYSQLTNSKNNLERLSLREKMLAKHLPLLKRYPALFTRHYMVAAKLSYELKLRRRGRKHILSIIRNTPFNPQIFLDFICYELTGKEFREWYSFSPYAKPLAQILKVARRVKSSFRAERILLTIWEGAQRESSLPLRVAYAGFIPKHINYYKRLFFGASAQQLFQGYISKGRVKRFLERGENLRQIEGCAVTIFEHFVRESKKEFESKKGAGNNHLILTLPDWIKMEIYLTTIDIDKSRREESSYNYIKRIIRRTSCYYRTTTNNREFILFYYAVYMPYTTGKFGDTASLLTFEELFTPGTEPELFLLYIADKVVGGVIVKKREGEWLMSTSASVKYEEGENRVIGALYYFVIKEMQKRGEKIIHIGDSRPLHNDGVTRYKRRLLAKIEREYQYTEQQCTTIMYKLDSQAVKSHLAANQFIYLNSNLKPEGGFSQKE